MDVICTLDRFPKTENVSAINATNGRAILICGSSLFRKSDLTDGKL
jgi:hypothetical protein